MTPLPLIGQMFDGMQWLIVASFVIFFALVALVLSGTVGLFSWLAKHNFGFTVEVRPDGTKRMSISLLNLLLWCGLLPAAIGIGWRLTHLYADEYEAERQLKAAGVDVFRWNDALLFEHEHVLFVDFSGSHGAENEMRLLRHFPGLSRVTLGPRQLKESVIESMKRVRNVRIDGATIGEREAEMLVASRAEQLVFYRCQIDDAGKKKLHVGYSNRVQVVD